jgi:hypothetical protein
MCSNKKPHATSDNTIITTLASIQAAHWEYITKSCTPHKVYVGDFLNHFPLPTQYRYRFTTLLAHAQGLFTHPVLFQKPITALSFSTKWFYVLSKTFQQREFVTELRGMD